MSSNYLYSNAADAETSMDSVEFSPQTEKKKKSKATLKSQKSTSSASLDSSQFSTDFEYVQPTKRRKTNVVSDDDESLPSLDRSKSFESDTLSSDNLKCLMPLKTLG